MRGSEVELDGEVLAEERVDGGEEQSVRVLQRYQGSAAAPILRPEVRTAALAAAGGALAGAATVAAVRAVGAVASRGASRSRARRRSRPLNIIASRSFLVDVHLVDR